MALYIEEGPEDLARRFHEAYERLAPSFGYETREESAVPWDDVPEQNRALMIAVCAELLGVREEEPSPPTPDFGWIGTHRTTPTKRTALLIHGDWAVFGDGPDGDDEPPASDLVANYTWEPPPEEEPVDDFYVTNEDVRRGREAAAAAMAVGVPEPDPQPIAWQIRNARGQVNGYAPMLVEAEATAGEIGGTVHAVMPAGWLPAGTPK